MTYVIGITGGIGCGKTVVSDHFASLGAAVIDTDVIARMVVEPEQPALLELAAAFGRGIILESGQLDRAQLRKLAFANSDNKAKLDAITHPAIRRETFKQVKEATSRYSLVVAPLLTAESPFSALMQRILVVTADRQVKIQRIQKRSGLELSEIESIMKSQLNDDQRKQFADDIITNDGTIADAQMAVERLHLEYLKLANGNSNNA